LRGARSARGRIAKLWQFVRGQFLGGSNSEPPRTRFGKSNILLVFKLPVWQVFKSDQRFRFATTENYSEKKRMSIVAPSLLALSLDRDHAAK
jgi:hypothetical protein